MLVSFWLRFWFRFWFRFWLRFKELQETGV